MKRSRNFGLLFGGTLLLMGCATDFSPPESLGDPDLYCEQAGDQGRFLRPGDKPEYVWPTEHEGYSRVYYYLARNLTVTMSHKGREDESMSAQTRRLVERILADYRQRTPASSKP